jgi:hypothetical protein
MSAVSIRASWTCHACHATAESSQYVTVLEMALRNGAILTPPRGWTRTNLHAFCDIHGDPLPAAAHRLQIPETLDTRDELKSALRRLTA